MKIIALTGPKGSGKDTVASIIADLYKDRYQVKTIAFADPIKSAIEHIFQLPTGSNRLSYDKFKRSMLVYDLPGISTQSVSARHVVREIGMMMRQYDDTQFNRYVESQFAGVGDDGLIVVTDLRFDNEYMMLKKWGAKFVKIIRPDYSYDGHITERGFDDYLIHKKIMNDGDLGYLRTRTAAAIDSILQES
jgi:pantothenate kinase-related protein Tda10